MKRAIPRHIVLAQEQASDPKAHVFVSANAGSGKTHVLAQRVVRILLEGVAPAKILCLTFTRAAAANMAARVSGLLARWTLLDDAELAAAIAATGASAPKNLDFARKLFALALDAPGGLKIQTLHAFCERLLHVFPFEANVPVDFETLDDLRQIALLDEARRFALDKASPENLEVLSALLWEGAFAEVLDEVLSVLRRGEKVEDLLNRLKSALQLNEDDDAEISRAMIEDGLDPARWLEIADLLGCGSKTDIQRAETLREAARQTCAKRRLELYSPLFFTEAGEIRAKLATKAVLKIAPSLEQELREEAQRLQGLIEKRKKIAVCERTSALFTIGATALGRYESQKQRLGRLDFDDLIERTRTLLNNSGAAAWALYKLDGGLDHILIDEAQDTSPAQWDIVRTLAEEFLAGHGARKQNRAIFAVGDEKQSIFSFQGARPEQFAAMRRFFDARARASRQDFHHIRLDLSFRSAPEILRAVDLVFASPQARRGLTAEDEVAPHHEAFKSDVRGSVELWPPLVAQALAPPSDWTAPLDAPAPEDPQNILARRIAQKIKALTAPNAADGVVDEETGVLRSIRPGDIMILVRRRNAFFNAMIRALKEAGLPVAGADRLDVGSHLATQDLVAAIKTALTPEDDLTLACALKSPLMGLDDEDLIALAPERENSLWAALQNSPLAAHQRAVRTIEVWRQRAKTARPFDFLSDALGPDGGRRAFLERLGPEAADAIDELLHLARGEGRDEPLSLTAFVHAIEHLSLSVRRDLEAAGDQIRVMTVHAAKGLEAKVVFLPDTCGADDPVSNQFLFDLGGEAAPAYAFSPRESLDCEELTRARKKTREKAREEYRRLLYVAMTRAEERLYISGYAGVNGPQSGCWFELIAEGLGDQAQVCVSPFGEAETIMRFGEPATRIEEIFVQPTSAPDEIPDWLLTSATPETAALAPLRPASALAAADTHELFAPADDDWRQEGILAHALLRALPNFSPNERETVGRRLAQNFDALPPRRRETILRDVLRTIASPELTQFFQAARTEIAFCATIPVEAVEAVNIIGRMDRLVIHEDEVLIADFKTGAPIVKPAAIRQMALYRAALLRLYPTRKIRAFLIFTRTQTAKELEAAFLDATLEATLGEALKASTPPKF